MRSDRSTIAVLGDGGWGTTLAIHLHRCGHDVRWWGAFPAHVKVLDRRRENVTYLPDIPIPRSLRIVSDLSEAVASASIVILAIPSQYLRSVLRKLRLLPRPKAVFVNAAKGLERGTLRRMSEVVREEMGEVSLAVLSGPNIASEIARGHPASSVVASKHPSVAAQVQRVLMNKQLRIYTSSDVIGVELGGALKNPIAIAAGIVDGLELGTNAKAALITRGVVEMARLGCALGAREETFAGLSGLGDLVTTCLAGRNRWLGEQLGKGKSPAAVLASTPMVLEGVETANAARILGRRHRVELPIIEQVHAMLFQRRSPTRALQLLMSRRGTSEVSRPHSRAR